MPAVSQKVLNWLYSVLTSEYHDVNRTYHDVAHALSQYDSLTPRTDVYTFETGHSVLLLHISGTLPVTFRGAVYRFPIDIWVPHAYARDAPIVYVTPAQGMAVRAGQHVSGEGRIYHPYLARWHEFSDKSNVSDLLGVLIGVFAKEPPVIATPQQQTPSTHSVQQAPPARPPLPPELNHASDSPQSPSTFSRPTPPPKTSSEQEQSQQYLPALSNTGAPLPPPRPDKPTDYHQYNERFDHERLPPQSSRPPPFSTQPAPLPYPASYQAPPAPLAPSHNLPPTNYSTYEQNQPPTPAQYQAYPPSQLNHQPLPPNNAVPQQRFATQPHAPPDDILSLPPTTSDPLPAPPIPPNPEKTSLLHSLAQNLHAQREQSANRAGSTLTSLRAQHDALFHAQNALQQEMQSLETFDAQLATNERILADSTHAADGVMASARERKPPPIDDVLVAPTVVAEQLYDVVAEERALGDALFALQRVLDAGHIDAALFARQTRSLARERFLKLALQRKIAKGMGLDLEVE